MFCFSATHTQFAGPGAEKVTVRARAISSKLQELFGLPSNWKPKCHGVRRAERYGGGTCFVPENAQKVHGHYTGPALLKFLTMTRKVRVCPP